jgi:hypothetical protein
MDIDAAIPARKPFAAVSSFIKVYKVALLHIFMRFPVRGEEPPGLSPRAATQDVGSQGWP